MTRESLKRQAAEAAVDFIKEDMIIGVGTGSTVNYFIEALSTVKSKIEGAVASSVRTAERLKAMGISVFDLNTVSALPYYFDGADEINPYLQTIKGGGGALTREKIIATVAARFICMAEESKWVKVLGVHPVALEVLPMARSYVARQIVELGGSPVYRQGYTTDNGNIIIDVHHLDLSQPIAMETILNNITGVICHGLFAKRAADYLCLATASDGVKVIRSVD